MLKKYDAGALKDLENKRGLQKKIDSILLKLIDYLKLRTHMFKQDKYGVTWLPTKDKFQKWSTYFKGSDFKWSNSWVVNNMICCGTTRVNFHDEEDGMIYKEF